MGTIDYHRIEKGFFLEYRQGLANRDRIVIRGGSPPQDQVAIGVARGADNRGESVGVNA